ncbi:glycosyltransferase family 2 protein [Mariniflexile jejuense]|uniref:Glycosyltransferase family 2 protein n=1 Tax=Mariniflexile jejuense TaxID=1173582 RepID=A0ABW3JID4_9FLAO
MLIKNSPIFSIIIPTYNSGKTISVALDSIISQTFKNLEVLIIDNLSTDDTIKIIENYKEQFTKITINSERDKGIYDAMNKGIDLAKGEWLYFMGSDDSIYESTTLQQFANRDEVLDFEVVYGNVYSPRFNGIYDGEFTFAKLAEKNICHQAIFFKSSVFKKIGSFNLKYKIHADWDHNMRWFYSKKISKAYINQVIAYYSDNGFSSLNEDNVFKNDKFFKLLKLASKQMHYSELILYCNKAIKLYKTQNMYLSCLVFLTLKYFYRILRKISSIKSK